MTTESAFYGSALQQARSAAKEAALMLLTECRRPDGPRGGHGHCPMDEEAEARIRARLAGAFPGYGYLGEETAPMTQAAGEPHVWLVDPNDGTSSMLQGYRGHAVSIALLRDGVPVLGVVRAVDAPDDEGDEFAWAEGCGPLLRNGHPLPPPAWPTVLGPYDVVYVSQSADRHPLGNIKLVAPARFRHVASIAYRLALVAAGEGVCAVSLNGPCSWDYAGGHALLRGVGGALVDERGEPIVYSRTGSSYTEQCFGGAPNVAHALASSDWSGVTGQGYGEAASLPAYAAVRLAPAELCHDSGLLRRAQGCLLGQVGSDALGALVEFQTPHQINAQYPGGPRSLENGGSWHTLAGQPTDDSELALMLARTLAQRTSFDVEAVAAAYARWCHGWVTMGQDTPNPATVPKWCQPFDVGTTTAQALAAVSAEHILQGEAASAAERHANRASQSNGALMRVSPLGIWGWNKDPAVVADVARADARLTHPHPVCQECSAVYAVTIAHVLATGVDGPAAYTFARAWAAEYCREQAVRDWLLAATAGPPADFLGQQGWVRNAFQNAFAQLLHAQSFEAGVVDTVRRGGDTDTNGAIAGALLGAVTGREQIPDQWRQMVLSCRPAPIYAPAVQPRPALYWPVDIEQLAERLLAR